MTETTSRRAAPPTETEVVAVTAAVADDSAAFRSAFADLLLAQAFSLVGVAASGEAAVELVQDRHPDVIFLDARMPGIGGVEACRQIHATCPTTRVVLITAAPHELSKDGGMCGASAVWSKDDIVQPRRFYALLNQLLE